MFELDCVYEEEKQIQGEYVIEEITLPIQRQKESLLKRVFIIKKSVYYQKEYLLPEKNSVSVEEKSAVMMRK